MILAQRRLEEIAKSSGRVIDERVRLRTKACMRGTIGQTDIPTHGGLAVDLTQDFGWSLGNSCDERPSVFGNAVDSAEQLVHARDHRDLGALARAAQTPLMRGQPWIEPDGDENRHPQGVPVQFDERF